MTDYLYPYFDINMVLMIEIRNITIRKRAKLIIWLVLIFIAIDLMHAIIIIM